MELLERERYLADLATWLGAAMKRGGCIALVGGEAGIGKTMLMQEFVKQQREMRVLWGACDALFTPRPLAPLHDIARQTQGALSTAMTTAANRDVIFNAALDELERSPALIVFEDMHWADEASLDLLKYLGRRIARTRAMLIATYRNDEVGARHPLQLAIGNLPGEAVHRLPVPSLSAAAVAELAEDSGRSAEGLHTATTGNPFYVTEVLAAPPGGVPASVRDAVLARIGRLSDGARKVAELAALIPGRAERWLIHELLDAPESLIDECGLCGMTRDHEGSLAFRHELSRRAVESAIAPAEARAMHSRILGVLTKHDVSESRLVHHANQAGDISALLRFAPHAADRAAEIGAHREAVAHYRAALAHRAHLTGAVRARLLDRLAYELYLMDLSEEAVRARMDALAIWRASGEPLRVGDTLRWLSRLSWFRGRGEDAERYAQQAVEVLEPLGESRELAMAYSNVAQLAMLAGRRDRAVEWGERAITLAKKLGDQEILAHALNNVGTARTHVIGDQGWRELEESLNASLRGGFQEHVARAYTNLSSTAITHREYFHASNNLEAGIAYCDEHELDAWSLYMRAYRARARFEQSSWHDALNDAEDLLGRPESSIPHRLQALAIIGRVRTRQGDDDPDSPLDKAFALAKETNEAQRIAVVAAARAELAWLRDDIPTLAREARIGLDSARHGENDWMQGELAFWLWRAGEQVEPGVQIAQPFRLQMQGECAEAARLWAARGCRYEEADALADSRNEADRRRALEIFDQLGAKPMARRLRRQLQSEGVRGLKRGANRATRSNPAGLTTRELEVLALLASDLSNAAIARKLFLSEKTVGHHASAVLSKLGIGSRREVGSAARKLGIEIDVGKQSRSR